MSKPRQTLADYVVIALSPAFIMALIGSFMFFLLEIVYEGEYKGRLQWILFFFVFGMVLVARISMHPAISKRASLYGLILALLGWVAMQKFVKVPSDELLAPFSWLINLGLVALVWWCAYRLVWDCTHIDDSVDASGEGLLQASGLEERGSRIEDRGSKDKDKNESDSRSSILDPRSSRPISWLERYRRYREQKQRKPHTPGVWVVYFSLAALPIFGLGQALLPGDEEGRPSALWLMILMCIYVGSGLGLLLTTSFLGLRRYLRQRQVQMPAAMTAIWLTAGGVLVVALLVAGAVLPRPQALTAFKELTGLGSSEREASKLAQKGDSPGKGDGNASDSSSDNDKGEQGSGDKKDGKSGDQSKDKSSGNDSAKDGKDSAKDGKGDQPSKDRSDQGGGKKEAKDQQSDSENKSEGKSKEGKDGNSRGRSRSSPSNPPTGALAALSGVANVLKWIVFAVLALVVIILLLRAGLQFLANFTNWARQLLDSLRAWWQNLLGWWSRAPATEAEAEVSIAGQPVPRPFASFSNPFRDGTAKHRSPSELVRYSFAALEAWAYEQELGRRPEETPFEFTERVALEVAPLEDDLRQLAGLFVRVAYAPGSVPANCLGALQQFWEHLEAAVEQPLSA